MAQPSDRSSSRPPGRGPGPKKGPPKGRDGGGGRRGQDSDRGGSRSEPNPGPKSWGSLARKGARRLDEDPRGAGTALPASDRERDTWEPEEWVDEGPVRDAAKGAVSRGRSGDSSSRGSSQRPETGVDVGAADLSKAVGAQRASKVEKKLREAAEAFDHERFGEARSILAPLVQQAPRSAALRELNGLTLYRMGKWKAAAAELEAFREISGSTEQHPVLADCYRAQKRFADVDELWEELRDASPNAPLVTEGRIVVAGSLADRGRLDDAIALLSQGFKMPKNPKLHHLRRAYALADLEERAGDVPAARSRFEKVAKIDPDFADVADRCRALG